MKHATLHSLAVIATLTTGAGCFEIAAPDLSLDCGGGAYFGSFHGRATGLLSDTLVGCAVFRIDAATGSFSMVLTDGGPTSVTPRVQMVRASIPRAPLTVGEEPGQITVAMFVGSRRFVVTGSFITDGPERLHHNEMGLSGRVSFNGVDSVGAVLDIEGAFVGKCMGSTSTFNPQDQLKPVIAPECMVGYAALRAPVP